MQYELVNLFAVPVYKSTLGRAFTEQELAFFKTSLTQPVQAISNYASANKAVLDEPELKQLRSEIEAHINSYFERIYNTANDARLVITQSWLAMTGKGGSHHNHSHPNSIASGVVYISLAEKDGINFYRNEDQQWFDLQPKEHNYYNAYSYHVETRIGDVVIFPSHIKHGVRQVSEDVRRISLAFNTFISGEIGHEGYSNRLKIEVKR